MPATAEPVENPPGLLDSVGVVAEALPDAIIAVDDAGRIALVNSQTERLLGWSRVELVGSTVEQLVPAHLRARHVLRRRRYQHEASSRPMGRGPALAVVTRDGAELPVDISLMPIRRDEERYTLATIRDLREATRTQARLEVAEENYRRLIEEIPLVTYVQRSDGAFEYVSPQAEGLLGYPAERWLADATFYENALHEDDREAVLGRRAAELERGEAEESDYRLVGRDGRAVWVHDMATFEPRQDGRPASRRGFLLDLTERKLAESALSESEQQLSLVFNGVSDLLFLIRVEPGPLYRWLAVNDAFRRVTGLGDERIVGRRVEEILPLEEADAALQRYEETIAGRGSTSVREKLRLGDGRLVDVETRLTPVFDVSGRCTHLLGASRDVSAQELLAKKLREAEKLQAVGRLAGGIAHDFNNLLTVTSLAGEHLRLRVDGDDLRDVEQILTAAERATALTRQLLAFSRRQMLQPVYLDLNEIVSSLDSMLRPLIREDVELVTCLAPGLGSVNADRSQLEQVIVNLVVNARDAMPRGGQLAIGTEAVELDARAAWRLAVEPGSYVRLWVSDTGVGMDEALRASIFEPYFTTKGERGGSGLGLATVHGIVHQSGGAIEVESEPGEGTTFSVYLRLVEREPERAPRTDEVEAPAGSGTILLVEDEEPVRQLAERALGAAGYTVVVAGSGGEALELAGDRADGFDLVVTDVVMPGMSGPEFAERLRAVHPRTRVL